MPLVTRLFVFAVGLTAVLSVWKIVGKVTRDEPEHVMVHRIEVPHPPAAPRAVVVERAPDAPPPAEASAPAAATATPASSGGSRIVTTNGAAFMELRGDVIIGGLTDSMRIHVQQEMQKEQNASGGRLEKALHSAVVSGVSKLLEQQVKLPLADIERIEYTGSGIQITYRGGKPRGVVNFETIDSGGDKFLSMFRPDEARRFVTLVREQMRTR